MSVVEDIKARLDLVALVSETVKLRKTGRSYIGFCPFHQNTRTPSFVVWPETQTWRCFGACAEGGDVFAYMMKREGLDFRSALPILADRAGVELSSAPEAGSLESEAIDRLRQALHAAAALYHHLLRQAPEGEIARQYVSSRGLSPETVELFQMGYAPQGWDRLLTFLSGKGFTVDEQVEAGLLTRREDGRAWDRFRHRLIIPIRDVQGQTIGFAGRALGDELPKYLNSPQTPLFDKGATLFALDLARRPIQEAGRAVIVEGYMDAMQAHQAGFKNVVAEMGTTLSEAQLKLLTRFTRRLVLALDPDPAGLKATLRGLEVARETLERDQRPVLDARGLVHFQGKLQVDIRALTMPDGLDPDDLIRKDPAQWTALADKALPIVEFILHAAIAGRDLSDNKAKAEIAAEILPLIQDVIDPVEQDGYIQRLARLLRVSERALRERTLAKVRSRGREAASRGPVLAPEPKALPPTPRAVPARENYLLGCILRWPGLIARADALLTGAGLPGLSADDFTAGECREVFRSVHKVLAMTSIEDLQRAIDPSLQTTLEQALAAAPELLSTAGILGDPKAVEDALDTVLRVRDQRLMDRVTELPFLLEEALSSGDSETASLMQAEIARVAAQRSRLHQLILSRSPTAQRQREDSSRTIVSPSAEEQSRPPGSKGGAESSMRKGRPYE